MDSKERKKRTLFHEHGPNHVSSLLSRGRSQPLRIISTGAVELKWGSKLI